MMTFKGKSMHSFIKKNKGRVQIGKGKDGIVFKMKVKDTAGGFVYVAIKQLKMAVNVRAQSLEATFAKAFAEASDSEVFHINLVTFYGAVKWDNHALIIMDLCAGDLPKLMAKVRTKMQQMKDMQLINEDQQEKQIMPELLTSRMFACVLAGLKFLYVEHKIYHSDIKPANILYKKLDNGSVIFRLGDFSPAAKKIQSEVSG